LAFGLIGEVLAIRRCDVDVTTSPATLRIPGTIVSHKGQGTHRQLHPKTDRSNRVIALPSLAAEAILPGSPSWSIDHPVRWSSPVGRAVR
jgi:hypothetical protein